MTPDGSDVHPGKPASLIVVLASIWFFISPWVYGVYTLPNAWNSWVVSVLIFTFAATRFGQQGLAGLSWANCILGIWTFASPWIYGYTGTTGRFVNSLCVGVIVFIAALASANAAPHTQHPTHQQT